METFLFKILNYKIIIKILDYVSNNPLFSQVYDLNKTELIIIVALAAVLIIFIAYRWLGLGMVLALLIIYLVIYVLYVNNFFSFYEEHEKSTEQHLRLIEEELKTTQ